MDKVHKIHETLKFSEFSVQPLHYTIQPKSAVKVLRFGTDEWRWSNWLDLSHSLFPSSEFLNLTKSKLRS